MCNHEHARGSVKGGKHYFIIMIKNSGRAPITSLNSLRSMSSKCRCVVVFL